MNLSNFTIKAAEAIQQSQQLAFNYGHSNIETEHILKSLLDQENSPVEFLLKKNAVNIQQLETKLDQQIEQQRPLRRIAPCVKKPPFLLLLLIMIMLLR